MFSFVNIQNVIGATILFNNNPDERSVERGFNVQLKSQKKSPPDDENRVKTRGKPCKTSNIITQCKTIKKLVFILQETDLDSFPEQTKKNAYVCRNTQKYKGAPQPAEAVRIRYTKKSEQLTKSANHQKISRQNFKTKSALQSALGRVAVFSQKGRRQSARAVGEGKGTAKLTNGR